MINRRQFLKNGLALFAAPAIVKAENIMNIFVPSKEIITPKSILDSESDELLFQRKGTTTLTVFEATGFHGIKRFQMNVAADNNVAVGDMVRLTIPGESPRMMTVEKKETHWNWSNKHQSYTRQSVSVDSSIAATYGDNLY